jgi:hypothetical protein
MKITETRNNKCLLLNADYTPLHIIDWKKAIVWNIKYANNKKYGIEIVDFYKDDFIQCSGNKKIPIPVVAKTKRFFHQQNINKIIFSRKNIFIRDDYTCQYCGSQFVYNELTYDHVVPKSSWKHDKQAATTWTNIVTACIKCNRKKGNRTPKQAGMVLKNLPIAPTKNTKYLPIAHLISKMKEDMPIEWINYLPESYLI